MEPGYFTKGNWYKKIGQSNRSIPKNKLIADIFYSLDIIEGWGTGFKRIISECISNGNKIPEFETKVGAFVITFYKKGKKKNEGVNKGVNLLFNTIMKLPAKGLQNYLNCLTHRKKQLNVGFYL